MIFSFSILMLISMLIFLFIALSTTKNVVLENSTEYTTKIISQVNTEIDSYFTYMENISTIIAGSKDVPAYFYDEDISDEERVEARERIESQFLTIRESRNDISNIGIISKNEDYIINDGESELTSYLDARYMSWYLAALSSKSGLAISSTHVQNAVADSYKWVITLSKSLVNNQTGDREGVLFVDLNYDSISELCDNNRLGSKGYVFILDNKGNIVYHPKQQLMFGGLKSENIDEIMSATTNAVSTKLEGEDILYTLSKSSKTGFTVVGAVYTNELLTNSRQTSVIYFLAMVILLVGVIIVSIFLSREITKPIRRLRDSMSLVEKGEFNKASIDITTNNELGSLTRSFNIMTDRIQNLMEANVKEQADKRKSEMKALQAQINPHFLYNTLDSIVWMSEANRNEEVVLMTSSLARLFRQSISNEKEQVTLREEVEYVKNYLIIQKMRYKDKLEYDINIDEGVYDVKIIKFALQPLVENAIYHGLKYKSCKGKLEITAYAKNEDVIITIKDDGIGMDDEMLSHIFDKKVTDTKKNGVGVNNVQSRLQLYYGKEYGIIYKSKKDEGTSASIIIPRNGRNDEKTIT